MRSVKQPLEKRLSNLQRLIDLFTETLDQYDETEQERMRDRISTWKRDQLKAKLGDLLD